MNILLASSEAVPFCKTGGLADVVGALSQVFSRMHGCRVCLFLPKYRAVGAAPFSLKSLPGGFWVPVGEKLEKAGLYTAQWGGVHVYFVDHPRYFDRDGLYQTKGEDYPDNSERFIFFSRAVLEGAKFIGFKPEVIHVHDWQASLIPAYLNMCYRIDAYFAGTATVLTIHNIAFQGMFPKKTMLLAGFDWENFTPEKLEYYGNMNFLKGGMVHADILTTVSPTYAGEIQSGPEYGMGLEGVIRSRSEDVFGILNGLDTETWNPDEDAHLPARYNLENLGGKNVCKKHLQETSGLKVDGDILLAGVVSRLDRQKGLDIIIEAVAGAPDMPVQFALLGVGKPALHEKLAKLADRFPKKVFFKGVFDESLAHKIYAGSDIFLMPSRFEPCGLGQMISMRYGSLPVVARTGGLADSVVGYDERVEGSNGFVISRAAPPPPGERLIQPDVRGGGVTPSDLAEALRRAAEVYAKKETWRRLVHNAMSTDFSWGKSANSYLELYRKAISKHGST